MPAKNFESPLLTPQTITALVQDRGNPFKVVDAEPKPGPLVSSSSLPPGVAFVLCPPHVDQSDCVTINEAVYNEFLKGRGAAWMSGCPEVRYCHKHGSFQICMDPQMAASACLVTEQGLAAVLDTLEGAALDQCVSRHLTEGGDDRLHLNECGVNKYFCPPRPLDSKVVVRGSCTCSAPTRCGFEAARRTLRSIWVGDMSFGGAMEDMAHRLSRLLGVEVPHELILHPSGSDAELIPLAIAQVRSERLGCAAIVNIVVAAGEVGSGTAAASGGKHFSKFAPDGSIVENGSFATGFASTTEVIELKPRLTCGSRNDNYDELVREACRNAHAKFGDPFFVLHAVDGSKTGLRLPSKSLISDLIAIHGPRLLVCMDACQGRSEPEEVNWFLRRGACVLVTASKFYQAPGFCGAVLIPKDAAAELEEWQNFPAGLANYLSKYEVPVTMQNMRRRLSRKKNMGLLLRWTAGIREMDLFQKKGQAVRVAIKSWVEGVKDLVRKRAPLLELIDEKYSWEVGDESRLGGVNSVVSIKFLSACGSRHLDAAVLRKVHKMLTIDSSKLLPSWATAADREAASLRCMVGQPVVLGDFGVLRLAIGAEMARRIADCGLQDELRDDERILEKMCVLAQFCDNITL